MLTDYLKQPAWKLMLHNIDVDIDDVLNLAGLSNNWLESQTDRDLSP